VRQPLLYPDDWTKCNRIFLPGYVRQIAVKGHNNEWAAGLMCCTDDNSTATTCNNTGGWKCTNQTQPDLRWTRPDFDDSGWTPCVSSDPNTVSVIRQPLPYMYSDNYWIWSNCIITPPNQTLIRGWDNDAYLRIKRGCVCG